MKNHGPHSDSTYARRFDTWNNALREAGFELNKKQPDHQSKEWTNKEHLEKLYWDQSMSSIEIGRKYDADPALVRYLLEKHDIERRDQYNHHKEPLNLFHTNEGYEIFTSTCNGVQKSIRVHQLLAIAGGADPDTVFDSSYVVHHKINIPWLNFEDNIEVLTASEHSKHHHRQGDIN